MGIFGMFGKKKDKAEVDGPRSDMVGMMKMMASMSDIERKPMMKGRLTQLLSLDEERRQESIRDMVGAFHSTEVNDSAREKLVATRVEIIGEMSEDDRRKMMMSRAMGLKVDPQLDEADQQVTMRVLPQISESARAAFIASRDELMKNMGG